MAKLKKGTKVRVYSVSDNKDYLGVGEITGYEKLFGEGWEVDTPLINVEGILYRGYECWWIRLSEAKRIEKSLGVNFGV